MSGVGRGALLPLFSVEIVSWLHGGRCVGPELMRRECTGSLFSDFIAKYGSGS